MRELAYNLSRGEMKIVVGFGAIAQKGIIPDGSLVVYPEGLTDFVRKKLRGVNAAYHRIDDGESGKTLQSVLGIIDDMKSKDFTRNSTVVSFGGGATSDATGLAAALYMRGINFISVPTTLLSMVDASMGGKNAVNYNGIKNLLGSFFSPALTVIDLELIEEMPDELIRDGLGEIAKYAIILDEALYATLKSKSWKEISSDRAFLEEIISRCAKDKMEIVARDEFDTKGERILLNFGHTVGHAIEAASGFRLSHGVAVSYGIIIELGIGVALGYANQVAETKAKELLNTLGLPPVPGKDEIKAILPGIRKILKSDKKSTGSSIMMPIPERIGKGKVFEVDIKDISDYLERISE